MSKIPKTPKTGRKTKVPETAPAPEPSPVEKLFADPGAEEPKPKKPTGPLRPELQLYYDIRDGSYVSKLNGRFVTMNKADLQIRFKALGLRDDNYVQTKDCGSLREIDFPFYSAQNERMIDFAGPVAGRRTGIFEDSAKRKFLVTDEACGVW